MTLAAAAIPELTLGDKIWRIRWGVVLLLILIGAVGTLALYSAGGMKPEPWAAKHAIRFSVALLMALAVALIDIRVWMRAAYPFYIVSVLMLVAVDLIGKGAMGAQRWLDFKVIQIQPSELMKIALVMALARYYHNLSREQVERVVYVFPPLLAILVPVALVMVQPDLGTAMVLLFAGTAVMFVAGVKLWKFMLAGLLSVASLPIAWSMMRDYQRSRVLTFLDPDRDPLGAGYHITQSKIAIGSGGLFGKGFGQGTQSALNFLPEKHTDFIFTTLAEEFGFIGAASLLGLYALILLFCFASVAANKDRFGAILTGALAFNFFLYFAVNVGMVVGLMPVVGVPLPLVSYGGSAMLVLLFGFGLIQCAHVHRRS